MNIFPTRTAMTTTIFTLQRLPTWSLTIPHPNYIGGHKCRSTSWPGVNALCRSSAGKISVSNFFSTLLSQLPSYLFTTLTNHCLAIILLIIFWSGIHLSMHCYSRSSLLVFTWTITRNAIPSLCNRPQLLFILSANFPLSNVSIMCRFGQAKMMIAKQIALHAIL